MMVFARSSTPQFRSSSGFHIGSIVPLLVLSCMLMFVGYRYWNIVQDYDKAVLDSTLCQNQQPVLTSEIIELQRKVSVLEKNAQVSANSLRESEETRLKLSKDLAASQKGKTDALNECNVKTGQDSQSIDLLEKEKTKANFDKSICEENAQKLETRISTVQNEMAEVQKLNEKLQGDVTDLTNALSKKNDEKSTCITKEAKQQEIPAKNTEKEVIIEQPATENIPNGGITELKQQQLDAGKVVDVIKQQQKQVEEVQVNDDDNDYPEKNNAAVKPETEHANEEIVDETVHDDEGKK